MNEEVNHAVTHVILSGVIEIRLQQHLSVGFRLPSVQSVCIIILQEITLH